MANTLGSLVVKLGLDAAEFTTGLTKSEYQAQKFAQQIDAKFKAVARTLASIGIGAAVGAFVRDTISAASALDDLSDATGSSVESLSKLANQAKISGRDFTELQGLMLKLAAGMAGVDEEGSKTGQALKTLGVDAKDPAEALQQVAIALNKYADGTGKAALARDLFGKGGPAFLATLKDIAEAQDVAATVTAKQAAEAEALEKALRRLSVEGTTLKNVILTDLVPWLNTMLEQFREGINLAGGFWRALVLLGTAKPFNAENLRSVNKALEDLKDEPFLSEKSRRERQRSLEIQRDFMKFQQRQEAMAGAAALGYTGDVRDYLAQKKPPLNYTGTSQAVKADKDRITDAERYLRSLQEQLDKTRELTVYDRVLNDLLSGRLELAKGITAQELLGLAQQIDAANQTKRLLEEEAKAREQAGKIALRAQEEAAAGVQKQAESNQALRDEIELIGASATKRAELERAHINAAIAAKEEAIAVLQLADGDKALVTLYEQEVRLLRERQGLVVQKGMAEQAIEDSKKAKEFVDSLGLAFSSAFEDAIVAGKSFRDVLHGIEQDIVRIITRKLVTEPLAGAIGDMLGGAGFGAAIAKNFTFNPFSLFGGGSGINFGSYATGPGMPQLGGFSGTGFASGTNYAPGGWAMVGERGPEMVNLPRGAQVVPNSELVSRRNARGGPTVIVNVMPGASRATVDQARLEFSRELARTSYRNG